MAQPGRPPRVTRQGTLAEWTLPLILLHGAVQPPGDLGRAGFSRHRIATAVAAGTIVRHPPRAVWASAGLRRLRAARELNGLLTCVSAAPCYGLWHLMARPVLHLCRAPGGSARHRRPWPLQAPPAPGLPVAGLADVLIHALHCLPELEAPSWSSVPWAGGRHHAGLPPQQLAGNRNGAAPGRCWTLSFRGPIRCWKFLPTPPSAGPGCTCAGMWSSRGGRGGLPC